MLKKKKTNEIFQIVLVVTLILGSIILGVLDNIGVIWNEIFAVLGDVLFPCIVYSMVSYELVRGDNGSCV